MRVRLDVLRLVRLAVATKVRHDDLVARVGERRHLVAPHAPVSGKPWSRTTGRPLARHLVVDPDAVVDRASPRGSFVESSRRRVLLGRRARRARRGPDREAPRRATRRRAR